MQEYRKLAALYTQFFIAMTFRVYANKGFQIVLPNGYEISCMFGFLNYCQHRNDGSLAQGCITTNCGELKSKDCEIAVYDPNGYSVGGWPGCSASEGVAGWQSVGDLLNVIDYVRNLTPPRSEVVDTEDCCEEHY